MNRITTCPNCSKRLSLSEQITDKTLICPHCLANVDNPQSEFQIRAADINTDVKRDLNVGCIVLTVLIGLCVLGVVVAASHIHSTSDVRVFLISSVALAGLLITAIVRGMVRRGRSGDNAPIVAGMLGITLIIVALVLVTIFAAFLFLILSCKEMLAPVTRGH